MRYASFLALLAACAAPACNSISTTLPPVSPSTTASTLNIEIKDSPYTDAQAILVAFGEMSVDPASGAPITVPLVAGTNTRTCDLKMLATTPDLLATGALPVGHYTGIRFVVTQATLYLDNPASGEPCASVISEPAGKNAVAEILSGAVDLTQSFDITATAATTITLDFNGAASITTDATGADILTPVVTVVSVM